MPRLRAPRISKIPPCFSLSTFVWVVVVIATIAMVSSTEGTSYRIRRRHRWRDKQLEGVAGVGLEQKVNSFTTTRRKIVTMSTDTTTSTPAPIQ